MGKIYQLISSVQLGGAEIVAFHLAERCGNGECEDTSMTVVELYPTQNSYARDKKKELLSKNIHIATLCNGSKRMSLLLAPFALLRFIRKEQPAVIHSHSDLPDLVLSLAKRLSGLLRKPFPKIVRTIHNTQLWRTHHLLGRITESAFRDDSIVAVSTAAMAAYEGLRRKNGLPVSRFRRVIFNGCALPGQSAHPFLIDKEKTHIAFCGRFEEYKGVGTLVRAIPEIMRSFPRRFRFHLIGGGSCKTQLEQLAREFEDVFLYDPVPNISSMFHAFDYLLMPSLFEGLALTSIEASFAGLPVIASHAPGLDETLPETWPLKFHLDKPEELYAIFAKISHGMYNTDDLRKIAYGFVHERFSIDKMIQLYHRVYSNWMGKKNILFLLHLPPPVHGSSIVGEQIKGSKLVNDAFNARYMNLILSGKVRESGKVSLVKILRFAMVWLRLLGKLLRCKPDICYYALTTTGFGFYKDVLLVGLLRLFRVKVIYHIHNKGIKLARKKKINHHLYRFVFKKAQVILLSKQLYYDVEAYVPQERVFYCPNGIQDCQLESGIGEIAGNKPFHILFFSNLIEEKGVFVLVEACAILRGKGYAFHCEYVGGEGDVSARQFNAFVQEKGLAGHVEYAGKQYGRQKEAFFARADVFVLPSRYDCFPLVILEAMQHGLPVITAHEGGMPDMVEEGMTGFLLSRYDDAEALAGRLELLMLDPHLRKRMGENGRRKYEEKFTLPVFEQRVLEIIKEVVN